MNQSLGNVPAPADNVLGWLQEPLAHNLTRLTRLLDSWRDHPADLTPLLPATGLLQEMTGALIVADADAAVPLLEEMQHTAHALLNGAAPETCAAALEQAIAAMADYFRMMDRDNKAIPYHLVAVYYALRSARGASPSPRTPRLQRHALPGVPREPSLAAAPVDLRPRARKLRPIYQTSLVHWYRRQNTHNYLQDLLSVLVDLERHTPAAQALLWWIGAAVAEALLDGGLPETDATRLLLGQLDPAIKRCAEHGAESLATDPPLGLMEALLDTLQQAQSSSARVCAVKTLFHLDVADSMAATNPVDASASAVVRRLAFELRDIKLQLGGLIHSPGRHTAELAPLILRMQGLAGALAVLRQSEWRFLVIGQLEQLEIIIDIEQDPGDVTLMEITSTLSYVENALEQFSEHLDHAASLPQTDAPATAWNAALHHEAAITLDRIKEALLLCASDPEVAKTAMAAVPDQLDALVVQVDKAGLNEVADLIGDLREFFATVFLSRPRQAAGSFDRLADVIAAIDFFLENLARGCGRANAILARGRESLEQLQASPQAAADTSAEPLPLPAVEMQEEPAEQDNQDEPPSDASQLLPAPDASQILSSSDASQSLPPPPAELPMLAVEMESAAPLEDLLDDDVEPLNEEAWAVVSGELAEIFIDEACSSLDDAAAAVQRWLALPNEQTRAELQHHLTLLQSGADMAGAEHVAQQCRDLIATLGTVDPAETAQHRFAALRAAILELAQQHGRSPAAPPTEIMPTAEIPATAAAAPDADAASIMLDAHAATTESTAAAQQNPPAEELFGFYLNELHRVNAQIREQLHSFETETGALLPTASTESALSVDERRRLASRLSDAVADLNEIHQTLRSIYNDGAAHDTNTATLSLTKLQAQLEQVVRQACAESGKQSTLHIDDHEPAFSEPQLLILLPALEQILHNAVTHGIELAEQRLSRGKPATGQIDIRLLRNNGNLVIVIRDDGAGVNLAAVREQAVQLGLLSDYAPPNNPELFRLLLRPGVGSTARSVGLAEVNEAVAQLGGKLEITSTLHQGSCVTITLPDAHTASADQPVSDHPVTPAPSDRGRPLVMIVDDSITVRKVMERLLRRHDYPTMSAEDGDIALALMESRRPDVVIVDMEMPEINGLTLVQAMDRIESLNGMPVIMITSRLTDPAHLAPRAQGQTFSLSKPYRELDLIELLDMLPVTNRNV